MRASIVAGIDRTSYMNRSKLYGYLTVLDICFSCFIIAPLVVAFWSSTWSSLRFIQFSTHPSLNVLVPIAFGYSVAILFTTFQKHIQVIFSEYVGNRFLYFLSSRFYTEVFGIASVSSWYGVWTVFDSFVDANVKLTTSIVIISYIGLITTKTVRNITASPFAIVMDKKQGYCDVPTLFRWSYHWKNNKLLYIFDSIFSVLLVGTLVILVWRGAWCLLDQTIFPNEEDYELSGWTSLVIGYFIIFLIFILQPLMKTLNRKYQGWKRLLILDIYVVISFAGNINIWRGIWILLEVYTDLENSLRNCILLHFLSFSILVIFNSSNTLLVRGVYIDAEDTDDDCVEFPCYYFRLKYQEKLKEKVTIQLNSMNHNEKNTVNDTTENQFQETALVHRDVAEFIDKVEDGKEEIVSTPCEHSENSNSSSRKMSKESGIIIEEIL